MDTQSQTIPVSEILPLDGFTDFLLYITDHSVDVRASGFNKSVSTTSQDNFTVERLNVTYKYFIERNFADYHEKFHSVITCDTCECQTNTEEELAIEFTMMHVATVGEELLCEYEARNTKDM